MTTRSGLSADAARVFEEIARWAVLVVLGLLGWGYVAFVRLRNGLERSVSSGWLSTISTPRRADTRGD